MACREKEKGNQDITLEGGKPKETRESCLMYGVPILQKRKPQYLSVKRTEQGSVTKTQWSHISIQEQKRN